LSYAVPNAEALKCSSKIRFLEQEIMSDRLTLLSHMQDRYELILADPPYIRTDVIPGLEVEVSGYEPLIALDGGSDGLMFYKRIFECAELLLRQGGWLIMEIGYDQEKEITGLISKNGAYEDIMVRRDYNGNPRVAAGKKKHGR